MPLDRKFVQGCAEYGDAVEFTRLLAHHVRPSRMSEYNGLLKQVYACSSVCDAVTEKTIEESDSDAVLSLRRAVLRHRCCRT